MKFKIPTDNIDLSDAYIGEMPEIERIIRKVTTEFIQGVFEENLDIEIQEDEETGEKYVVVYSCLEELEGAVAEINVNDLFLEYLEKQKGKNT